MRSTLKAKLNMAEMFSLDIFLNTAYTVSPEDVPSCA
jgi:hypothetical protein